MRDNTRHTMKKSLAAAAVALTGAGLLGGTAGSASAIPYPPPPSGTWYSTNDAWGDDGDDGGVSFWVKGKKSGYDQYVKASFYAEGEHLYLRDYHPNGSNAIVRLWVGGSGPAVFYAEGYGKTHFNLSYDENQTVSMQVCTSTSSKAYCTPKISKGRS